MGGFPEQQTKRKTITEARKIYSVHFLLGTAPLPTLSLSLRVTVHSAGRIPD